MKIKTASSRVSETRRLIVHMIREQWAKEEGRLPSEERIAEMFGVSRSTVRAALGELESSGFIHRKHGLGTFVNPIASQIHARLDAWIEFKKLIEQSGFEADIQLLGLHKGPLSPDEAKKLGSSPGEPAVTVRKLFTADGQPAILCQDTIPLALLPPDCNAALLETSDTFHFLAKNGLGPVSYGVAHLIARCADAALADLLRIPAGTPLLALENVGYAPSDSPLFLSSELYCPGLIDFGIMRRHLY
ncbi:GntR family transcriptional regulator [Paenibacillus rigui]|uniref:HTH gntR-type domain-containing protein n=1 Tax=Paenibacillus rigui TaxID=554312 RepID=A0A229UWF2_9BACL|nr:GntR family transcriptional regulator [Paenibacillus rigui]OXM87465.1 hypothetical protein CF651_05030 [Paenibacillus rigui]